jgi:hypothetical protein
MSDITYLFLQMLLLLAYGCYVAYRVGYSKGKNAVLDIYLNNIVEQKTPFKSWKEVK